jgi:hypothetical protein
VIFLLSKEGVTQGCPLAMVAFGLAVMPLVRQLKREVHQVHQAWYADDAAADADFTSIKIFMERLIELGPDYGYYPEASKSILVVSEVNKAAAEPYFCDMKLKVVTRSRYLGGFIGSDRDLHEWLKDNVSTWEHAIGELSMLATKYPQSAYTGLQKFLQNEWQSVQRVKPGIGEHFQRVEKALATQFLPALFGESLATATDDTDPRRLCACLPVKHAGIAIEDPTATSDVFYEVSTLICSHLTAAVRGVEKFKHSTHMAIRKDTIAELRKRKTQRHDKELSSILAPLVCHTIQHLKTRTETGAWLSVMPSTVNGTELSTQEFRDKLLIRYARQPLDLPVLGGRCGCQFSVGHALECKAGGLVILRHNKINHELADLSSKKPWPPQQYATNPSSTPIVAA